MSIANQYCTFMLDDLYFGITVRDVQEVLRYQNMTPVPLANDVIGGLINLRGQIVTAVDLRELLEFPKRPDDVNPMNIVVRTDDGAISLLVDKIGDVLRVDDSKFEEAPETVTGIARELVEGAYKLEDRLLLVLDMAKTIGVSA